MLWKETRLLSLSASREDHLSPLKSEQKFCDVLLYYIFLENKTNKSLPSPPRLLLVTGSFREVGTTTWKHLGESPYCTVSRVREKKKMHPPPFFFLVNHWNIWGYWGDSEHSQTNAIMDSLSWGDTRTKALNMQHWFSGQEVVSKETDLTD